MNFKIAAHLEEVYQKLQSYHLTFRIQIGAKAETPEIAGIHGTRYI